MNFLTRILAVDVPENTTLSSWEPYFRGVTTGWLLFLLVVVLFGMLGVAFFYRLEKGTLGWLTKIVLIGLRCALILLLLFLILRPVLLAQFDGKRPRDVVLLIDNTQSMKQRDRRLTDPDRARVAIALGKAPLQTALQERMPTLTREIPKDPERVELVKGVLTNSELKFFPTLQQVGPLRNYFFGQDVRAAVDPLETIDQIINEQTQMRDQPKANVKLSELAKKQAELARQTEAFKAIVLPNKETLELALTKAGQKMQTAANNLDGGKSAEAVAQQNEALTALKEARHELDKAGFAARILTGFKADEAETKLADGIMKLLQAKDVDLPAAIVVITDGQDNASKFTLQEAALECQQRKIPLHIYGVGSAEGVQLQLKELAAPEILFLKDTVAIPLRWRAKGFKEGEVEITLKLGGLQVVQKKLKMRTGEDLRDVLNFIVPDDVKKGENQDLVVSIQTKLGNETIKDSISRSVRVIDTKIKVLYIENSPRWEFKFLQPILVRDRRFDADPLGTPPGRAFILLNADPKVANEPPYLPEFPKTREKFFEAKYNLIILGDVPSTYFSREQMEWIREFVQNRGGLIVLAGRQHMPGSYKNTPIAEVLPVEFEEKKWAVDADVRTQEYPPTLTPEGERTDWLALADVPEENLDIWQKKLLGFHWFYPVTKLKPAATALVTNPRAKMGEQPMPLMATHFYGKGQVLWMGSDETWRWRWNYQDKYFVRFWGQILYQFGLPSLLSEGASRVQMALDRSEAVVGKPSKIFVRLLDKDFNPRKDASVDAELLYMDAKPGEERKSPVKLMAIKSRPGEYIANVPNDRAGRYELHVKNPEDNSFSYRVELPPKHELEEAGLNEEALRDAAKISGGRFYREEDLHHLAKSLETREVPFTRRQEVLLWNPLALLLFLGLITTEWLVRKFSDLS